MTADPLLARLHGVRKSGDGWSARCPAHDDRQNSLSVNSGDDGRILLHCFAGCRPEGIVAALGLEMKDLFPDDSDRRQGVGGLPNPPDGLATLQAPIGCTLAAYAAAKRLPEDFLRELGMRDVSYLGRPAIAMPYLDADGAEQAVRFRLALEGAARFRWRRGAKPCSYGLWRLDAARVAGHVVLVEGESDAQTLWYHAIPALGLPGAATWRDEWAAQLDGIPTVYAVLEPDRGGDTLLARLGTSPVCDRLHLVHLGDFKDPSALYLADPEHFQERWKRARATATPWAEEVRARAHDRAREAWARCASLARAARILDRFAEALAAAGVAGEARAGRLLYLVLTTRLLDRPVSATVKGPSSAGKSYLVERVLKFFPPTAAYVLSAMSEKALAYSQEPLDHRFLVIYEAAGLKSNFASYLVRSLLSEGRVRYETVDKTKDGLKPRLIERVGPTGLLVTTTAVQLHPENETRLLSIPVTDSPDHTKEVLRQVARAGQGPGVDFAPWHALQQGLALIESPRVTVPYAERLAELIPPVAVRLRRDFSAILALIGAHALLHQASRAQDEAGAIVTTLEDYAVVRELVADLVAEGVEVSVSAATRETVEAVQELRPAGGGEVTVAAVARKLKLDESTAWRRVRVALNKGYLQNLEEQRGRPARLALGEPLPEPLDLLPDPEALAEPEGCRPAPDPPGEPPSPLPEGDPGC